MDPVSRYRWQSLYAFVLHLSSPGETTLALRAIVLRAKHATMTKRMIDSNFIVVSWTIWRFDLLYLVLEDEKCPLHYLTRILPAVSFDLGELEVRNFSNSLVYNKTRDKYPAFIGQVLL